MPGRVVSISSDRTEELSLGWEFATTPTNAYDDAGQLQSADLKWLPAQVPGTVASALLAANEWSLDSTSRNFDGDDYWYRLNFQCAIVEDASPISLDFAGLATIADIWLNGQLILQTDNMFRSYSVRVERLLRPSNQLLLHFKALDPVLAQKRPRPKWRTPMIAHQQLRHVRTTLLGRTPGWSPSAAAVGPWGAIEITHHANVIVSDVQIAANAIANDGSIQLRCSIDAASTKRSVAGARLFVRYGDEQWRADCYINGSEVSAQLTIRDIRRWWPHTHGEQNLYDAMLEVTFSDDSLRAIQLRRIGFRSIALDTADGNFKIAINAQRIFCRGVCWTPIDTVKLHGTREQYRDAIAQVRAAGFNMLRVGGTMVYESDYFYDECDRQGILVWQEFMFASMDYPDDAAGDNAKFISTVTAEAIEQLARFGARPAITVICGNSEVEQQAAMWGATRDRWQPRLFHEVLPALVREHLPHIPYWPSSAHGGAFPHQGNIGTTSYYGVGAYMRDLNDARRAEIRFATECLAFANIPENSCIEKMPKGHALKVHHPEWKARTPRDLGAGWDFEDVRDFYLRALFAVDPMQLRYTNHDRYLDLSRVVTGEAMAATFVEWRRLRSTCNGALVWFLRDLVHGAGWGIIDADGNPKAPYHFLKRVLQSQMVAISDEGGNGLAIHIANDGPSSLNAELHVACFRDGETQTIDTRRTLSIDAHQTIELAMMELLDGFSDINHAYRFGPPMCDLVIATLSWNAGQNQTRAFYLPLGLNRPCESDLALTATARWDKHDEIVVTIGTRRFAQYVSVEIEGFTSNDAYFNVAPNSTHQVILRGQTAKSTLRASVKALNCSAVTTAEIKASFARTT